MLALVGGLSLGVPVERDASDSISAVNLVARQLTPSTGNRGAPGEHNTLASYMESKAAFELGDDTCAMCTPAENAVLNCCSPGASWEGQCDEGMAHSWLAGYAACNGGGGHSPTVSAASVIREERAALNETIDDLDPEFQRILQEKHEEHEELPANEYFPVAHGKHVILPSSGAYLIIENPSFLRRSLISIKASFCDFS